MTLTNFKEKYQDICQRTESEQKVFVLPSFSREATGYNHLNNPHLQPLTPSVQNKKTTAATKKHKTHSRASVWFLLV